MNLINYRQPESFHWYDQNGNPRHSATIREAVADHLGPSVTSVLAVKEKPALTNWKISQALAQALTMTRLPEESDEEFIKRIMATNRAELSKAPDLGTAAHAAIAQYLKTGKAVEVTGLDMIPVFAWIDNHVTEVSDVERSFHHWMGFGGCIDLVAKVDGVPAIVDWKTQGIKEYRGARDPAFYEEWCWQLAAYDQGYRRQTDRPPLELWSVIIDTKASGCYPHLWGQEDRKRGWMGFCGLLSAWMADRHYDPSNGMYLPWLYE